MKSSEEGWRGPFSVCSLMGAGTLPPGMKGRGLKSAEDGCLVGCLDSCDFDFDLRVDFVDGSKSFGNV